MWWVKMNLSTVSLLVTIAMFNLGLYMRIDLAAAAASVKKVSICDAPP